MGLFDKYMGKRYLGDPSRAEFTKDDLPATRIALFFAMLRIRAGKLFVLNACSLIFLVPLFAWTYWSILALTAANANALNLSLEEVQSAVNAIASLYFLVSIPLVTLSSLSFVGVLRVTRNWARDENAWVWHDFWVGIRENWKQALVIGFINGVVLYLAYIALSFYAVMQETSMLFGLLRVLVIAMLFMLLLFNIYLYPLMVYYKLRFRDLWRNSVLLAIARFPFSLLFGFISLFPLILVLMFPTIGVVYMAVYAFAFHGFILSSYTNSCFEKFINVRIEGAPVNAGLRPQDDWDDDDFDDEDDDE